MESLDQSKEVLASFGMEILKVNGTTEAVHHLFSAIDAVQNSTASINTDQVSYLLFKYAQLLNTLELQAKYSGKTLKEYTGCAYEEE